MMKLLKYELRRTWRIGVTLLVGILLGSLGLVLNPFNPGGILGPIYMFLCGLVLMVSPIALFIYCIISFNQEFVGGQGYLLMTLPIKAKDFIWAKFTSQLIWNTLSGIILLIGIPLIVKHYTVGQVSLGFIGTPYVIQSALSGISSYVLTIFIIYFSIVVLSTRPRNSHITFVKIILAVIITNIINLIVGVISVLAVGIPFAIKEGISMELSYLMEFSQHMQNNIVGLNLTNIIINILITGIFYVLTKYMIENKVQL